MNKTRKRVLVFIPGYLPAKKYGGPVTSIKNMVNSLNNEVEFFIIALDSDLGEHKKLDGIKKGWNKVGTCSVLYVPKRLVSLVEIYNSVWHMDIDYIYINSVYFYKFFIIGLILSIVKKIPVIIAPRGEMCNKAIKLKKTKKRIYINFLKLTKKSKNIIWHSTCKEETEDIIENLDSKKLVIKEIPNLPCELKFRSLDYKKQKGYLKIVFISRITPKKNLKFAIEVVNKLEGKIIFDIYGTKEDEEYFKICMKAIDMHKPNVNIEYKGYIEPEDINKTLHQYDVFLFPTISENYGHVIAEALRAGCPILISNNTPWNDVNNDEIVGALDLSNKQVFIDKLNILMEMDEEAYKQIICKLKEYNEKKFDSEKLIKEYNCLFE